MNAPHSPLSTRGFTLLELMIAISLGMMIVYTATAAFRVASQSVTTANRLSLENAVLRAGYQLAHRDLDFWTNVDNPEDPTRQGLRADGLPFASFSTKWPASTSDAETAMGHDPRDEAWAMGNPRVWWRGNMAEKGRNGDNPGTDLRFGRYALFANTSPSLSGAQLGTVSTSVTSNDANGKPVTTTTDYTYLAAGGTVNVPHSWIYNQIDGAQRNLGFYGLCDYLPANAIYAFYQPRSLDPKNDDFNLGGLPRWLIQPGGSFNNGDGGQQTPRGKYRNSYQTSYGIIDPRSSNNANDLRSRHRRHYHLGYGSTVNKDTGRSPYDDFSSWSAIPDDPLASRPANWPGLSVSVQRFIKNTRFVNLARVRWTNSLTGEVAELTFSGFGTTLRGARQQRLDGTAGGWAKWDNDGSTNDKNLNGH